MSSSFITFDAISTVINNRSDNTSNNESIEKLVKSYKSRFIDGRLPYIARSGQENAKSTPLENKDFETHVNHIMDLLKLDKDDTTQLIDIFAKRIQGASVENPESSYSPSNVNVLYYFVSMITDQQCLYFELITKLIKYTGLNEDILNLKREVLQNGAEIIDNIIDDVEYVFKQMGSLEHLSNANYYPIQPTPTEEFELLISNQLNSLLSDLLTFLVYIILHSEKGFKVASVSKWLTLLETKAKLPIFYSSKEVQQSSESILTIITLLFLDLEHNNGTLSDEASFMSNAKSMVQFTNLIVNSNANAIILYAWSILLNRQHTSLEMAKNSKEYKDYVNALSKTVLANIELASMEMAERAAENNLCQELARCNDLVSSDHIFSSVLGTFVTAFVPYIEPTEEIVSVISQVLRNSSNKVIESFFANPFADELLILLKAKLPLSLNSFLELVSINANLAVEELRLLPTYMATLPTASFESAYGIDDQQPELIKINKDIQIDLPYELKENVVLKMAEGSKAQILSKNESTTLVLFLYEYNGWSLIGRILMNLSIKIDLADEKRSRARNIILRSLSTIIKDIDSKVISLLIDSLQSFTDGKKIFDIILRIFDQALTLKNSELATNCLHLLNSFFEKGFASTVWSFLSNSKLLPTGYSSNLAFGIIDTVEITSGSFSFVISLLEIANNLLDSALHIDSETALSLKQDVIMYFTNMILRIYENYMNWRFTCEHQKHQIGALSILYLNNLIKHGARVSEKDFDLLLSCLKPSFQKVVSLFFISDVEDSLLMTPLFATFEYMSNPIISFTSTNKPGSYYALWIQNSLKFLCKVIELRSLLQPNVPSALEKNLFLNLPNIVKAYMLNRRYRLELTLLITSLVCSKWKDGPPSMLTHLRSTYSVIFLNCLQQEILFEYRDEATTCTTFKLISGIMDNNQQGLSHLLLTGKSVLDYKSNVTLSKSSVLSALQTCLLEERPRSSKYLFYLLNAILSSMRVKGDLLGEKQNEAIVESLIKLRESRVKAVNSWDINVVSKTVEILSLYLYLSKNEKKKFETKICSLLNTKEFIEAVDQMFIIPQDSSFSIGRLDTDLKALLGNDFSVEQFQKKDYCQSFFNDDIFNTDLIQSMLNNSKMEQWEVYHSDLIEAEEMQKLLDAKISRASAYGGLITCFCNSYYNKVDPYFLHLSEQLLKINVDEGVFSAEQEQIYQGRNELALLIILTLLNSKVQIEEQTSLAIIKYTLKLLMSTEVAFFDCLKSLRQKYYHTLLKILLITVPNIKTPQLTVEYSYLITDAFKEAVCKPICEVFSFLRTYTLSLPNPDSCDHVLISKLTEDVMILLSLTQQFLNLNLKERSIADFANIIISTGAYRSVAKVFSSSHLIQMHTKESYIDYSMAFIFEFVQQKSIAEKLVHEGIFCLLTESPVANIIQRGNITPYSENKIICTLHRLWVKRLLPTVLTMAAHFGENIAIKLCEFSLTFKKQSQSTLQSWLETNSLISTSIIEETSQLVLLAKLLSLYDCYNIVARENGTSPQNVSLVPGLDTVQERTSFVNALNYLLTHPKYLQMKVRTIDGEMTVTQFADELKSLKDSLLV